jgi:hypothetical protein
MTQIFGFYSKCNCFHSRTCDKGIPKRKPISLSSSRQFPPGIAAFRRQAGSVARNAKRVDAASMFDLKIDFE